VILRTCRLTGDCGRRAGSGVPAKRPKVIDARRLTKLGRLSAAVAFLICAWLTPIQTFVWNKSESPTWVLNLKGLLVAYETVYEGLAPYGLPRYYFFGRMFFIVYLSPRFVP
jgi:hypothetical protein